MKLKDKDSWQEFNFDFNNWVQSSDDNLEGIIEMPTIRPDIAPLSGR